MTTMAIATTTTMTTTTTDRPWPLGLALLLYVAVVACTESVPQTAEPEIDSWSITAWGERFEVFPEVAPLVAGEVALAHTHVTRLGDFEPLVTGGVEIVLASPGGESVFRADEPTRPGIFNVQLLPQTPGEFDLLLRINSGGVSEEIRGGRVRVGTPSEPGGLMVAPAPRGGTDGGEALDFLKEQQWRSDFGTAWVRTGTLPVSVSGLATIRPPAGGESVVTATVDGVVRPAASNGTWPFIGMDVGHGDTLFRVVPLVATDRSLAALEAELTTSSTELDVARARLTRLEELLALEATSRREVEEAKVRVETLLARHDATARDLEAARAAREGGSAGNGLALRAPFAGEIAQVMVTPGATISSGAPLARLVRRDVVWIEAALAPADAARIGEGGLRGAVLSDPERGITRIDAGVRMISIAPELSARNGSLTVLLEAPRTPGLVLGMVFDAQLLSAEEQSGIVIPTSALVDDGGVPVVYLQLSGESFVRQEVRIVERQGDSLLVERLTPGQRLVVRGGDALRRASLMADGEAHGHVH